MDLQRWLEAARGPVVDRFDVVRDAAVSLWEGGVRFDLHTEAGRVGLKFRQREDGPCYASTASTSIAVELDGGATLSEPVERAIRALLAALRKVDDGTMHVPKEEIEELEHGVHLLPPKVAEHVDWAEVSPARDLALLGLACVADQRALLARWGEPDLPVVVLDGARWAGGRPLGEARDHAREAARVGAVAIDGRAATVEAVLAVLDAVPAASAIAYVRSEHAAAVAGRAGAVVAVGAPTGAVPGRVWRVVEADEVVGDPGLSLPEGWGVLVVPGDPAEPLPLDRVADALDAVRAPLALAGMPLCVAPERPRLEVHASLLGADPSGAVLAEVCRYCDLKARCPGIGRRRHDAWGMRGVSPQFTDETQPPLVGPTDPSQ